MSEQCTDGTDHPKRRRWDGNYDALPYETDEFDGGEKARLRYEDFDGKECAVTAEVGEFMSHNSWLLLFDDDGSGDEHIVRADGVVMIQTWPGEEIDELGRCIEVRSVDTGTEQSDLTEQEG